MKVEIIDHMGNDLSVVNAARVSFSKKSDAKDWKEIEYPDCIFEIPILTPEDEKLVKYLADHNHWTPFAHTSLTLHVKIPIFVARQLAKHQVGGAVNEVSRRYVDSEPEFYFPENWRERHEKKKQGSYDDKFVTHYNDICSIDHDVKSLAKECLALYNNLIKAKVCPEQARMVLPQNMYTEWYWTGSVAFFARVCNLRLAPDAQWETRQVAKQIYDAINLIWPVSTKYLCKH